MEQKPWYLSKTIWGALIGIAGAIFPAVIARFGGTEQATQDALNLAGGIATLVGSVLAIYGRVKAGTKIGNG